MTNITPCIELINLSKVFYTDTLETHALRDVNLTINQGEFISISGPSGCGKSSLLSILGLLDQASTGQYKLDGNALTELNLTEQAHVRNEKIGFVFQSFNLIDQLNVFDNIALPLRYRKQAMAKSEIEERVSWALSLVDMGHRASHKPNQLSGGQQQRIAIARALVNKPTILLVDEPTGNLDSQNSDAVMNLLAELNQQGTSICMVTHDPRYAEFANQKYYLMDGQLEKANLTMQEAS
jgi:putative ABC transport system ATP-binding protein